MANPIVVTCTKNTWVKVATNVTSGLVHILDFTPNLYLQTYRITGDPAPTLLTDAVPLENKDEISATSGIDVYIMAVTDDGKVRVDL